MKLCPKCGVTKDESEFHKHSKRPDGLQYFCKMCRAKQKAEYIRRPEIRKRNAEQQLKRDHDLGHHKPMSENRECASFLGVHVAERVLSNIFKKVERMPNNNTGYDFVCSKGYKIDVKSGVRVYLEDRNPIWKFAINKNTIADYFLCLAFDDREHLNPLHIWLIPGKDVSTRSMLNISTTPKFTARWAKYEKPLDLAKVVACCNILKGEQEHGCKTNERTA